MVSLLEWLPDWAIYSGAALMVVVGGYVTLAYCGLYLMAEQAAKVRAAGEVAADNAAATGPANG